MRCFRTAVVLFIWLNGFQSLAFCEGSETLLTQAEIKRVLELGHQIKCPVCFGQPVSESNAPMAQKILCFIAKEVLKNKKNEEILKDLEERFGDEINLNPPLKPGTYFLWFVPIFLFIGGVFGSVLFLKFSHKKIMRRKK